MGMGGCGWVNMSVGGDVGCVLCGYVGGWLDGFSGVLACMRTHVRIRVCFFPYIL